MRKIVLCLVMVATLATSVVFGQEETEEKKVTRSISVYMELEGLYGFNNSMNDYYNDNTEDGWHNLDTFWSKFGFRYGQNYIAGQEWLSGGLGLYKSTNGRMIGIMDFIVSGKVFGADNFLFVAYLDSEVTYGFETGWYNQKAGPVNLSFYVGGEFHGYNFKEDREVKGSDEWFEKVFCGIGYNAAFNSIFGIRGKVEYTWEDTKLTGSAPEDTIAPGYLKIDNYLTVNLTNGLVEYGVVCVST